LRAAALQPADGVQINYDLKTRGSPAGRLESIVAGQGGEWYTRAAVEPTHDAGQRLTRLDTRWQAPVSGALRSVVVGDTVGSGGGWSRPVRYGGVRIGRPARVRQDFDAGLEARVAGSAALPARAIPTDGAASLEAARALAPGADGASSPGAGMVDFEVEAGRLRSDWGTAEDHYGESYAATGWRLGLGPAMAAEARAEWTPSRTATGLEVTGRLDPETAVQAVVAQSGTAQASGSRYGLNTALQSDGAAWRLGWDGFEQGYTPLDLAPGEADPRARLQASAAFKLPFGATTGLSYTRQTSWDAPATEVLAVAGKFALSDRRMLTLSYSQRVGDVALRRVGLSFAVPLGNGRL
ncbi:MAG TPA: hypothetical protein VLJ86_16045, partial [Ramlibacter sp.]|nr:hypothetical protein [Ramlibacter sp.]